MTSDVKPPVSKEDTFDRLEIRLGRVVEVALEPSAPKPSYRIVADFGKFGRRTTVGRFTRHAAAELQDQLILGVLNFPPRAIGAVLSDFLMLGVQYPKADSGEATFLTVAAAAKIGGKVF